MKAWHFIRANRRLGYGDNREVMVGETLEMIVTNDAGYAARREGFDPSVPRLCKSGMHASIKVTDALKYAPGLMLCEVEIAGDIIEGNDKIVGRTRRVIRMIDATQIIVRFAAICSQRAAKYAAECAEDAAECAKYAAECAKYAAEYAKYAAEYAECTAKYAAECAEYTAKYAAECAECAKYAAESEREEQEKILLSLIYEQEQAKL